MVCLTVLGLNVPKDFERESLPESHEFLEFSLNGPSVKTDVSLNRLRNYGRGAVVKIDDVEEEANSFEFFRIRCHPDEGFLFELDVLLRDVH